MHERKPEWLRIRPPTTEQFARIRSLVAAKKLHTVCEEAHCPNLSACWSSGTATFMVLGAVCTRGCRFCEVRSGIPAKPDPEEPGRVAEAVRAMGLDYVVLTTVDRDDLPDQGAGHIAACIRAAQSAGVLVEILAPDFRGELALVDAVLAARPAVFAHNIETVRRLQGSVRDGRAGYEQSLAVLQHAKKRGFLTKSSIMIGLGETEEEVAEALRDLRGAGVDIVTLGQYLRPSEWHLPVAEYVPPEQFAAYERVARELGFLHCASGPFVRSSYKAGEAFVKNVLRQQPLLRVLA